MISDSTVQWMENDKEHEPVAAISEWRDDQSQRVTKVLVTVVQFRVDHSRLQISILEVTVTVIAQHILLQLFIIKICANHTN